MTDSGDSGFTLVEAVVALFVISLALTGLLQGTRLVTHTNKSAISEFRTERQVLKFQKEMQAKLSSAQPIFGGALQGDGHAMRFQCGAEMAQTLCSLIAPSGQFAYLSGATFYDHWPAPTDMDEGSRGARLEAVMLRGGDGQILALSVLPVEQPRDCQFDMISRTCRAPADSNGQ